MVEAKEEILVEQAMAASMMKRDLLLSLVQLQETRSTKCTLDNKFSVESIIKPSSLRKVSRSRKLPFERRRSFTEDTETPTRYKLRQRAMTVGPTRHFPVDDDDDCSANGVHKSGQPHVERQGETREGRSANNSGNQEVFNENRGDRNVGRSPSEEERARLEFVLEQQPEKGSRGGSSVSIGSVDGVDSESSIADGTELVVKQFSGTHLTQDCSENDADNCVIETSQFRTVRASAMEIEIRARLHRSRLLRLPRRHTIGHCKITAEKEVTRYSIQGRSKSSEGRKGLRAESPSPVPGDCSGAYRVDKVGGDVCYAAASSKTPTDADANNADAKTKQNEKNLVSNLICSYAGNDPRPVGSDPVNSSDAVNSQDLSQNAEKTRTDGFVQPGIVKRQSLLLEKAFSNELASSVADCVKVPTCDGEVPDAAIDPLDGDLSNRPEDGVVKWPKCNSVKRRLQQLEDLHRKSSSSLNRLARPASLNLDRKDQEVETEVDSLLLAAGHGSQDVSMLSTAGQISLSKSAPCSPKLTKDRQDTSGKDHVSSGASGADATDLQSKTTGDDDVFPAVLSNERPAEDVRSLVGKFEER